MRVNSIAPGPTRTRIAHDVFARMPKVIPPLMAHTGRLGEVDDVGTVVGAVLSHDFA